MGCVDGATYNELLVGSLLPFLVHGVRGGLGEEPDNTEDGEAGSETCENTPGDLGVGARGVGGTGTVGAKGDPVGCRELC